MLDVRIRGDSHVEADKASGSARMVAQWGCPDGRVRREYEEAVVGLEQAGEEPDLLHRAGERGSADDLDIVADAEGPEPEQHDARRDIGQGPLQSEADRQARGAERGEQRGGLHSELAQRGDEGQDQHAVASGCGERWPGRLIDPPRLRQRPADRARDPSCDERAGEEDENRQEEPGQQSRRGCPGERRGVVHKARRGRHSALSHSLATTGKRQGLARAPARDRADLRLGLSPARNGRSLGLRAKDADAKRGRRRR